MAKVTPLPLKTITRFSQIGLYVNTVRSSSSTMPLNLRFVGAIPKIRNSCSTRGNPSGLSYSYLSKRRFLVLSKSRARCRCVSLFRCFFIPSNKSINISRVSSIVIISRSSVDGGGLYVRHLSRLLILQLPKNTLPLRCLR